MHLLTYFLNVSEQLAFNGGALHLEEFLWNFTVTKRLHPHLRWVRASICSLTLQMRKLLQVKQLVMVEWVPTPLSFFPAAFPNKSWRKSCLWAERQALHGFTRSLCKKKKRGEEKEGCVDTKGLSEALSQSSPIPHSVPQSLALRLEVCNGAGCLLHMFGVKQALALYLRTQACMLMPYLALPRWR